MCVTAVGESSMHRLTIAHTHIEEDSNTSKEHYESPGAQCHVQGECASIRMEVQLLVRVCRGRQNGVLFDCTNIPKRNLIRQQDFSTILLTSYSFMSII